MKLSAQLQGLGLEELAKKARELENAIDVYEAIKDVSLTKDLDRIMELEGKAAKYDFLLKHYGRCCSVDMGGNHLYSLRGFSGKGNTLEEAIGNDMDLKEGGE